MSARLIDQLTQGFGVRPSLRVKRALFGPVDHEENVRFVQRELARNREEASQRWNYDFSRDVPLPGRYEWEVPSLNTLVEPLVSHTCDKDQRRARKTSQQMHITDYLQHRKQRSKSKVKVQERKRTPSTPKTRSTDEKESPTNTTKESSKPKETVA
ncbi:unnamed protein product [Lepeophtheirus salmonis]|uniref:(salmon louse) hypothetical protein n=1 Tax=Lepeophtheirus salmonis TaxID=72036 RepID=A0A0K2TPE4_LEPSM|nr:uncharacterized protein LOC121120289 [Lepeophtheirus salmonis]CAB4067430.1 unnamed protein product [Lepeophtheirus salmonis]CAF2987698.1 unnamed protein product [Lepeophtheirus salmonis]